jgi:hypothetical protein
VTLNVLSSLTLADLEEPGSKNVLREKLVGAYNQALGKQGRRPGLLLRLRGPVSDPPWPTNPHPPAIRFLDQSEIDKLLAQTAEVAAPKPLLIRSAAAGRHGGHAPKVEAYDFRNPAFLSEVELRRLRLLHEDFIRYLSARLSLFLRMEFGLKMAKLTTVTYSKFTGILPNPTHLCLFKAEPLIGVGILDINPRLALTIADRLLGGRGHSVKAERYLTEIEVGLLEDVILIILEEWCGQWKVEQELHPLIIGHENNGRFLQTSPKDAIMLALTLECHLRRLLRADPDRRALLHHRAAGEEDAGPPPEGLRRRPRPSKSSAAWSAPTTGSRCRCGPNGTLSSSACAKSQPAGRRRDRAARIASAADPDPPQRHAQIRRLVGLDTDRVAVQITRKAPPLTTEFNPPPNPMEEKTLDIVLDVKVKVTVQLGSCLLPMRDVLELWPRLGRAAQPARERPGRPLRERQARRLRRGRGGRGQLRHQDHRVGRQRPSHEGDSALLAGVMLLALPRPSGSAPRTR